MNRLEMGNAEITAFTRALTKVEFFAGLTIANIDLIMKYIQFYEYDPETDIFKQGDPGDAMYVIYEGQVEVFIKKLFSKKKLSTLMPGQIFGEMALLDQKPRSASVKTLSKTKLFVLLNSDFDIVLRKNPTFAAEMRHVVDQRKFQTKKIQKF